MEIVGNILNFAGQNMLDIIFALAVIYLIWKGWKNQWIKRAIERINSLRKSERASTDNSTSEEMTTSLDKKN